MTFPFTANALSATTAHTIQGNKPILSFDGGGSEAVTLDYLLSFDMPDGVGGTTQVTPATTTIEANREDTFDSFATLVTADGVAKPLLPSYYYDKDGDTPHATSPVVGTLKATWSYKGPDGKTKNLSATDLTGKFNSCNSPYTLKLEASGIKVQSAYGDPLDNNYGSQSKSYTVNVEDYRICYAKPAGMDVNTCTQNGYCKYSAGYNTAVFVPSGGFLPSATTKFPTAGFHKAQFTLQMSNLQSDYTYSSSNSSIASIDHVGVVTLNSTTKPMLPLSITLTATPTDPAYLPSTYQFTINKWARSGGQNAYSLGATATSNAVYPVANGCAGHNLGTISAATAGSYLFKISDLTNTPYRLAAGGLGSRDIDGSLFGEWGSIGSYSIESGLVGYFKSVWTNEIEDAGKMYLVNTDDGSLGFNGYLNAGGLLTICSN